MQSTKDVGTLQFFNKFRNRQFKQYIFNNSKTFYSLLMRQFEQFIARKQVVQMRTLRDKSNVIKLPTMRFMWGIAYNVRIDGWHINATNLSK